AGEGLDPVLVIGGAPAQHLLAHRWDADDVAEEVHHLLGPRQAAEIATNDNAVETVKTKTSRSPNNLVNKSIGPPRHAPEKSISSKRRTRQADGRWRALSPCRRDPLYPPPRRRARWARRHHRSTHAVLDRKPATPGSSTARITWRSGSPVRATPNPFHIEETE